MLAGKYPTYWNIGGGGSLGLVAALDIGHGEPPAIGLGQPPFPPLPRFLKFVIRTSYTTFKFSQFNKHYFVFPVYLFCFVVCFYTGCFTPISSQQFCSLFVYCECFLLLFLQWLFILWVDRVESGKPLGGIRERLWRRLRQAAMFTNHLHPALKSFSILF